MLLRDVDYKPQSERFPREKLQRHSTCYQASCVARWVQHADLLRSMVLIFDRVPRLGLAGPGKSDPQIHHEQLPQQPQIGSDNLRERQWIRRS